MSHNGAGRDVTVTKRVLDYVREANDFVTRERVIAGVCGREAIEDRSHPARNAVSAALTHLVNHHAVEVIVDQDDTKWYAPRPETDDDRTKVVKEIVQGITKRPHSKNKQGGKPAPEVRVMAQGTAAEAATIAAYQKEDPVTSTDKKVTRVTTKAYPERIGITKGARGYGKERRIALTILPGDNLFLRPLRLQDGVYISIEEVYKFARRREAMSLRAQEMNAKKRSRKQ